MNTFTRTVSATAAFLILSAVAFGQTGQGGGRTGQGGNYDPATEVTLKGSVDEVKHIAAAGRGAGGVHLMFRTEDGSIEVDLGPAAYIQSKNFAFAKGDALTIIGSKVKRGEREAVIAREVTKGDKTLTLRDAKGFPLWSRRGAS
jgi:hypothetical protein